MNKADMRKGMLLKGKVGAKEKIYRVLDLKEKVLVLDCVKKTMPVWKTYEELSDYVEKEEESMAEAIDIIDAMEGENRKTAYQRYNMISGILPFISEESMRTEAIKRASERYGISKQTVRNYLCGYLATMDVRSLAPGNKKAEKKLSADEKNMRKSLNKWYYTTKKRTLKNCYTLMLQHFYCNADGSLKEQYPSYYQFRYFYRKYNKKETEYISRNGLSYYQRNQRPLTGDGVQAFAPTIGMGMLDATVCDIYLVNESGAIVGRPILTLCVDAYSGVICGYSLSWEGGIYSLRNLMLNVIADKVKHCRKYGIEIKKEQWPSRQLPLKLVTDQGSEYKGENFAQITDLGVELINLKSFRADEKGPVEQCFNALQNYFKPILKGKGVIETDFQERGVHDYRKDACLTMNDFEKVILHCIIFYNSSRILERFPFTEDMLEAEVKPIPCHVWKMALFQEISSEDLCNMKLPDKSQEQIFDEKVKKLQSQGLKYPEIAKRLNASYNVVKPIGENSYGKYSHKKETHRKCGVKKQDWAEIDKATLPLVKKAIKELQGQEGDRPRRVNMAAVSRILGFPDKRLKLLPKSMEVVMKYSETQEQYWAKEVVWAVNKLEKEGKNISQNQVRRLTNMRKDNLIASIPHLEVIDSDIAEVIKIMLLHSK